jgi:16S rRNA (uracil1498-N3)-methyltransferase
VSLRPFVLLGAPLAEVAVGAVVVLSDEDRHHLRTVLRLRAGAEVELADGRGTRADGVVDEDGVRVTSAPVQHVPARPRLALAQALPKGRRFDEVLRQATELGVDLVVPVAASRSITELRDDARLRRARDRWTAVARAACEQARRAQVPELRDPVTPASLPEVLTTWDPGVVVHVAHPGGPSLRATSSWSGAPALRAEALAVAIGPEGGWTEAEVAAFVAAGAHVVGLGGSVLRTEHAGAAALAALAALSGRWDGDDVRGAGPHAHGA